MLFHQSNIFMERQVKLQAPRFVLNSAEHEILWKKFYNLGARKANFVDSQVIHLLLLVLNHVFMIYFNTCKGLMV